LLKIYWTDFHNFSPNDKYLFVDDRFGPLFPIPQGTLLWQPILGELCEMTFIWQAGVPKRTGICQFQYKNIQWQYCSYILIKIDPVTPEIKTVTTALFWMRRQKLAYPTKYLSNN